MCKILPRKVRDKKEATMWQKWNRSTKPLTRPVKSGCERRRRSKVQKKRLIALGVPESKVAKMKGSEVREMLRRPARIKK